MQFNRAFDRSIEVRLAEVAEQPKEKTAVVSIADPVHQMALLAGIDARGFLTRANSTSSGRPFPQCRSVIDGSGQTVWTGVNLRDVTQIEAGRTGALGCEHIAELTEFLAAAYVHGIGDLRLTLTSALNSCTHTNPGQICSLVTRLQAASDRYGESDLTTHAPVIHQEFGLSSKGSKISAFWHPDFDVRKAVTMFGLQDADITLKELVRQFPELILPILLLRLYRQTRRALLSWGGARETLLDGEERAAAYDGLAGLIRLGKASTILCGAFAGAGIKKETV